MSTALMYIRQSRHRDYLRTVSPQVQEEGCRGLPQVATCNRVEVFVDLDTSGKSVAARPEFRRFLDRMIERPPHVVALYDQSRSFRNTAEALDFYALMERLPSVEVAIVHGSFDRSPTGEFSYTTLAAAHTMERRMVAEKMRDTYRYRAARGEMVGQVPAGFIRGRRTRWRASRRPRTASASASSGATWPRTSTGLSGRVWSRSGSISLRPRRPSLPRSS